jgi:hypothetical protein
MRRPADNHQSQHAPQYDDSVAKHVALCLGRFNAGRLSPSYRRQAEKNHDQSEDARQPPRNFMPKTHHQFPRDEKLIPTGPTYGSDSSSLSTKRGRRNQLPIEN